MKNIERKILDQIIVTENPAVHVNYIDGNYYPEILNEKDTFYLKHPQAEDYSESMMFGWFNYHTLTSVLGKYAGIISEEELFTFLLQENYIDYFIKVKILNSKMLLMKTLRLQKNQDILKVNQKLDIIYLRGNM